jgi:hypothetical protein
MGTDFVQNEEGILETSLPEISATTLASLWPGSASAEDGGVTTIDFDGTTRLADADYADWELQVPGYANLFGFYVNNGINLGSLEFSAADNATAKPRMELHSRWDPAALTTSPHGFTIGPLASA